MSLERRLSPITFNGKNWSSRKIIIVLSVLLCIILIFFSSATANVREVQNQLQQNLTDVAAQNAEILHTKIKTEYDLINGLSKELENVSHDNIEAHLDHFKILMEDFNLKRFAFCFPDGTTYSTDTKGSTDLSYRDFFQAGMQGKSYITGVLTDALNDEHTPVNVMTIPVQDDTGNITGVFGLAYDTNVFNESLQIESFEGQGYSCVINGNGEIMATTEE